ncbi:MAG: hypothetical protein PHQ28_07615 [Mycobacterium sp.]|nr:hypothetical protein [Mycobacterium sp.]
MTESIASTSLSAQEIDDLCSIVAQGINALTNVVNLIDEGLNSLLDNPTVKSLIAGAITAGDGAIEIINQALNNCPEVTIIIV